MPLIPRLFIRTSILICFLFTLVTILWLYRHSTVDSEIHSRAQSQQQVLIEAKEISTIQPLSLNENECKAAFPSLFTNIDTTLARGNFSFSKSDPDYTGLVQGRIQDGKLYILTTSPTIIPQTLHQRTAILSQIHRALIASPSTLPDMHFAFCTNDVPKNNTWGFSRPNKASLSEYNTWLMPSFASWSWPNRNLSTTDDILDRISAVERQLKWEDKLDKVIWRGTPWFNPIGHLNLRKDLLKVTRAKEWADVEALRMRGNVTNGIMIEEFCRYKYVVYTEGVTYSGRLPFHQACGSVLIMARVTWVTSTALLLRPIEAEDLMKSMEGRVSSAGALRGVRSSSAQPGIIQSVAGWQDANAIYVNADFSNLEAVILFLREHPEVAQRIAWNQRKTVVERGYLSMAAETCYWRALIRAWAKVAEMDTESWGTERGERYETWLLKEVSRNTEGVIGNTRTSGES